MDVHALKSACQAAGQSFMNDMHFTLGAGPSSGTVLVTLFIPSVDRDKQPINQAYWREEALRVMGTLFGGATAFPPGRGVWRDDERSGELVYDDTVIVVSYASSEAITPDAFAKLRRFLHRLGREARQGQISVVVDGVHHPITQYDLPENIA